MKTTKGLPGLTCLGATSYGVAPLLLLLLSPLLFFKSTTVSAANDDPAYTLQAKPSICVSYNSDEPCTMALDLSWKGPVKPELCLREQVRNPALQCWQNSERGNLKLNFANTVDVQYLLEEAATSAPLAETSIKVINRDLRSSRTRRRHIWSIL